MADYITPVKLDQQIIPKQPKQAVNQRLFNNELPCDKVSFSGKNQKSEKEPLLNRIKSFFHNLAENIENKLKVSHYKKRITEIFGEKKAASEYIEEGKQRIDKGDYKGLKDLSDKAVKNTKTNSRIDKSLSELLNPNLNETEFLKKLGSFGSIVDDDISQKKKALKEDGIL